MTARTRPKEKPRGGPGWLATAAVLLLLIVVGFTLGMLAGVVWDEPDLLLAYLTGETEDVAWSAGVVDGQAPQVVRAPPRDGRAADPQVRREQARAAEPETPPVAAAPVGRLEIQVGAFVTSKAAERLATSLRDKGFPVYVSPGAGAGEAR